MIEKPYFVILNHPNGSVMPLVENDEQDLMMFESERKATICASDNPLGENFGFEVFELGNGCLYQ